MTDTPQPGSNSNAQLKSIVDRIEALEASKQEIAADIKDVYTESHGNGFDPKIIRRVISIRKQDKAKRDEAEAILERYLSALGMI